MRAVCVSLVLTVALVLPAAGSTIHVPGEQPSIAHGLAFAGSGDYHLTAVSPARNRGWPSDVRQDIDGEPRDPLPDLGADEFFDPDSIRQVYLPLVMR